MINVIPDKVMLRSNVARAIVLMGMMVCYGAAAQTTNTAAPVTTTALETSQTSPTQVGMADEISTLQSEVQKQQEADPDSEPAATALDLLNQASDQLRLRDRFSSETRENEKAVREAGPQLQQVRLNLEALDSETTTTEIPTTATVQSVEQHLASTRAELGSLRENMAEIQAEQQRRAARTEAIPRELVEANQKQSEARIALQSPPGVDDPLVGRARQLFARTRLAAADAQTSALQTEQARYAAREELLPAARQLVAQRISNHEAEIAALENRLAELRRAEATASARQLKIASSETQTSDPLVRQVAAENTSITAVRNMGAILEMQDQAEDRLRVLRQETEQTSNTFNSLRAKFDLVGYSDALGILLRRQRKELPNTRRYREHLESLSTRMADVNLQMLETQDRVNELANPDEMARAIAATGGMDLSTTAGRMVKNEIARLLEGRRDYLGKVAESYDKLFQTLVQLNAVEQSLVQVSSEFKNFIDERILWLPSTERISWESVKMAASAFVPLATPNFYISYVKAYWERAKQRPVVFAAGAVLFLAILLSHREWKRRLHKNLATASKNRLAEFSPLLHSLLYVALYTLPLPVAIILLGLPLQRSLAVPLSVASFAEGLVRGGVALFVIRFLQVITRRNGVAEVFFAWQEQTIGRLRHALSVLTWIYVPAIILVRMWQVSDSDADMEATRIVLVVALGAVLYFAAKLLWPKSSVLRGAEFYRPGALVYRMRYVIFAGVTGGIAVLMIGALMGYLYTALELSLRLNMSLWMGSSLLIFSESAFFWVLVKRRRLAIEEARKRREAIKAQQQTEGETPSAGEPPATLEPALDIASISNQAGRLLRTFVLGVFLLALWGIWAGVLPALNYLDTQPLWSVSRTLSEVDPSSGNIHTVEKLVPITLANLMLALLVCVVVVVALKNIPGLLDISIYQRLGVQAGEKYAFNTLIRYVLIILATVYVLYLLGLQWKQIQWLVAAVSVGLGFGLQEIFANFVSGLILLFERPIRVGDVVTVGSESGRVSQIRIRATTVVNWDHRILIIPNKELITKSVLNWTLVDSMMRMVLTISVAYGSDYDKAREIILNVAKANPYILKDPGPAAAIEKTTIAGVDIQLLAHLPNGDNFMDARHEIVTQIEKGFREAGIKLAAQRMDLEIRRA